MVLCALFINFTLHKLGLERQRLADFGDALVEVHVLGHHQHRLGEVQGKQTNEALGVHDDAAVLGVETHAVRSAVGQRLQLLQLFDVMEAFLGDHRKDSFRSVRYSCIDMFFLISFYSPRILLIV